MAIRLNLRFDLCNFSGSIGALSIQKVYIERVFLYIYIFSILWKCAQMHGLLKPNIHLSMEDKQAHTQQSSPSSFRYASWMADILQTLFQLLYYGSMQVSTNALCKIWKAVSLIGTDVEEQFFLLQQSYQRCHCSVISFVNVRKHGWCVHFASSDCQFRWYSVILELAEEAAAS